ncbi:ribonuclease P/MRP protein subunit POP5-like isoform X2 [Rhopilema esculentum]|uniref:ribonuclease P/MRP protein subunit POP5-like isoform X2 n=1 Tax=Rhopilema esculentum TaxID=499914 RepID=UPI0031D3F1C5
MVRVKKRYIVLKLHCEEDTNHVVSGTSIYQAIKRIYHELYGDFGIAHLGSFGVKYYDQKTKMIFIQCNRDPHRNLMHAATLVKSIDSRPFSLQTLYIAGTMKSCQKFLLQYSKEELLNRLEQCKENSSSNFVNDIEEPIF